MNWIRSTRRFQRFGRGRLRPKSIRNKFADKCITIISDFLKVFENTDIFKKSN